MHEEPAPEDHAQRAPADFSGERFQLLFEESPLGMAIVDLDGSLVAVNDAFADIVGYSPDELRALRFQDITHPDDLATDLGLANALLRGEIPHYSLEKRYVRKDGGIVHVVLHGSIVRRSDGRPLHFLAQVEDVTERRRIERRLRENEHRFRLLAENARDVVFRFTLEPRPHYEYMSPAVTGILGYAPEEFYADPDLTAKLVHPDDLPQLEEIMRGAADPSAPNVLRWRRKDGRLVHMEQRVTLVRDASGRPVAFEGISRDVTARVEAETELETLRRRYEAILASAGEGIYGLDLEGRAIFVNPAATELVGWAPEEILGRNQHDLIHHSRSDGTPYPVNECPIFAAFHDGRAHSVDDEVFWRRDGTAMPVHYTSTPLRDPAGRLFGAVVIFQDISDRRRLLERLDRERRWLSTVIDHSPVGIVLVEKETGRIVANRRAEELLESPSEVLAGSGSDRAWLCSRTRSPLVPDLLPLKRALDGEAVRPDEYLVCHPGARRVPVLVSAAPIRAEGGTVLGAVAVFEDLTVVKELEQRREEWASLIAHDLRQPISVITAYAGLLARSDRAPDVLRQAEHIRSAATRLARMTADLQDASMIESSRITLRREPLDLGQLVEGAVERAQAAEGAERLFQLNVEPGLPRIFADPGRVEQVLANLLSNACKYGRGHSPIDVSVTSGRPGVTVAVTNEGPDIPPDTLANLFSRFHRAPSARESSTAGLGLGLYISRGLIEAHGGRIEAESREGRTTFRFELPL